MASRWSLRSFAMNDSKASGGVRLNELVQVVNAWSERRVIAVRNKTMPGTRWE